MRARIVTPDGPSPPRAEVEVRAWIEDVAARSTPPLESHAVETRFGTTHMLRTLARGGREALCLPGWGTCSAFWAVSGQLAPLAEVAPVSLLDVPGQPGLSAGTALPGKAHGIGAWLGDVVDALELEEVDLIGSSLGALLSVRASLQLGRRIRRLVLLAPAGFVWPLVGLRGLRASLRFRLRSTPDRAAEFIDACLLGDVQELGSGARAELARALALSATGHATRALPPLRLCDHELRDLDTNLLIVVGERDPVFSHEGTLRRARRLIRRPFDHVILPGHGHALELSRVALSTAADFLRLR